VENEHLRHDMQLLRDMQYTSQWDNNKNSISQEQFQQLQTQLEQYEKENEELKNKN